MSRPSRVLALCAGYGGLELALASVEDIELVAYAEYDDAPARIMAHHHPDVPNLRDVKMIDWKPLIGQVDVMTAGYPCQPFSHAGKRQGEDDPRHLWPHIATGIGILRPRLCFFENVRGHLSLGLDQVLLDLDALGYDVRVYLLRAADVGAAHGRARVFIFAEDRAQRGPVELPFGSPVAVARDGQWFEPESHLFGAAPFEGKLPGCSRLVDGHLYAEPAWTSHRRELPLLQTPIAAEGKNPSNTMGVARRAASGQVFLTNQIVTLCGLDPSEALLPTPVARDHKGDGRPGGVVHARKLARHEGLEAHVTVLLPTPVADNSRGLPSAGTDYSSLPNAVISHWGDYGPAIARWETVVGRPAPAPTEAGPKVGQRLSPRFVEWLMGLPDGWVCDVPDITRNQALKALGNGVVWQQAAAAYRAFLTDTAKEKAA